MITLKTIKTNGGCTLNKQGNAINHTSGFQVSKCDLAIIPLYKLRKQIIATYLNTITANENLGLWIENNKVYIDISEHITNYKHALKVGKDRKQISIYGWSKNTCYYC